jgi:hypothetical protein
MENLLSELALYKEAAIPHKKNAYDMICIDGNHIPELPMP